MIASPKTSDLFLFTNVSWLLGTRKDTIDNKISLYFLVCKGLSIDDVGVSRDTVFQEMHHFFSGAPNLVKLCF